MFYSKNSKPIFSFIMLKYLPSTLPIVPLKFNLNILTFFNKYNVLFDHFLSPRPVCINILTFFIQEFSVKSFKESVKYEFLYIF